MAYKGLSNPVEGTILTVANLKTLQVSASVDETTIKRVSAEQNAVITFDDTSITVTDSVIQ